MRPRSNVIGVLFFGTLCGLALFSLTGCSAFRSYPKRVRYVQNAFADADYEEAVYALEKMRFAGNDRLCFLLELGTFYHTMGEYAESNKRFLEAVEIMKEFDERAVFSVRDSAAFAASLLINDKVRPYRGSAFERVLLHTYLAMNFLLQHDLENTRVEILQAYAQQKQSREQHEKQIRKTTDEVEKRQWNSAEIAARVNAVYADQSTLLKKAGNVYQNAFTYYLSAVVYEMGGEISDAYIDAKTVHRLNPDFLPARRDLLRYSKMLGLQGDYQKWRSRFGDDLEDAVPEGHGEILLLYQCGLGPVKEEIKIAIPIPVRKHFNIITIAIPKYRTRHNSVRTARLLVDGKNLGYTQALMDVEATAVRDLRDQALGIAFRHLIRAAGRFAATEYARKKGGAIAFIPALLIGYAMEQADLRSWISLPRNFQALRVSVPAGSHEVVMELLGNGVRGSVTLPKISVRDGGITIIGLRSTRNLGTAKYVVF